MIIVFITIIIVIIDGAFRALSENMWDIACQIGHAVAFEMPLGITCLYTSAMVHVN